MFSKPPLEIPGTSIRPPDKNDRSITCNACRRPLSNLKKVVDPDTKKVKFICPFCGATLR